MVSQRISEVPEPFYKMRFETALVEQTHSASHAQNWKHLNKVLQLYTVCRAHKQNVKLEGKHSTETSLAGEQLKLYKLIKLQLSRIIRFNRTL